MYVAKIIRRGLIIDAAVFEKVWSEEFSSNRIETIKTKTFLTRKKAQSWANKEICKNMFENNRLEIIDE